MSSNADKLNKKCFYSEGNFALTSHCLLLSDMKTSDYLEYLNPPFFLLSSQYLRIVNGAALTIQASTPWTRATA